MAEKQPGYRPSKGSSRADGLAHLNQIDLARRWRISERTLERWRWLKQGPAYLKIGGHVVYRITDIEAYEIRRRSEPLQRVDLGPRVSP